MKKKIYKMTPGYVCVQDERDERTVIFTASAFQATILENSGISFVEFTGWQNNKEGKEYFKRIGKKIHTYKEIKELVPGDWH